MAACTRCHNGTKVSYECSTCHERDVAANSDIATFEKVRLTDAKGACYTCHQEAKCTSCHGTVMPHPQGWMTSTGYPGHAREGFANRQMCFRCHFEGSSPGSGTDQSCMCHGLLNDQHGGAAWVKEHGLQATGQKPGAYARCFDCHSYGICDACHPASYTSRYNPVTGPDNYTRDVPLPADMTDY